MSTTVVNTPPVTVQPPSQSGDNGAGFLLGILVLVVFCGLFYFFAVPSIREFMNKGVQVQVDLPSEVNVNVEQPEVTQ